MKCMYCQNELGTADAGNVCAACNAKLATWTTTETTTYGTLGWECPRCHVCHAPWVKRCDCTANDQAETSERSEV